MMNIKFPKFRLYLQLFSSLSWMIAGGFLMYSSEFTSWAAYLLPVLGLLNLGRFLYDLNQHYLRIENGTISRNILYGFKNKMNLKDIQELRKVKGDYVLTSETQKLKINLDLVDDSSLNELIEVLSQLDLPSEKTFFKT